MKQLSGNSEPINPHSKHSTNTQLIPEIWRVKKVAEICSISRQTLWRLRRDGKFPPAIELSSNIIGWKKADVLAWIDSLEIRS